MSTVPTTTAVGRVCGAKTQCDLAFSYGMAGLSRCGADF